MDGVPESVGQANCPHMPLDMRCHTSHGGFSITAIDVATRMSRTASADGFQRVHLHWWMS